MSTITDVAREAGVSTATASRALNNNLSVGPELSRRVRDAAEKLGYTVNSAARNLRRRETRLWALIVPDITNPFFGSVAHGVSALARRRGFSVLLCNSEQDPTVEREYIALAVQEQAAGIIFAPHASESDISVARDAGIPVVIIDRIDDAISDTVASNSFSAAFDATVHLLEQGWRNPACITGPAATQSASDRLSGYREAMTTWGAAERSQHMHTDFTVEEGRIAASMLLGSSNPPDAFLLASEPLALGALQEIKARKLVVGRDVGIISFDEAPWSLILDTPMSVVAQPAFAIGRTAASLLVDRIENRTIARQSITLSSDLIIRGSSVRREQSSDQRAALALRP